MMGRLRDAILDWTIDHPGRVLLATLLMVIAASAMIPRIVVDTDPENMLPADNPARLLHDHMKETFDMHDAIVVGLVAPQGQDIYTPEALRQVIDLTKFIRGQEGVVVDDVLSLATVDNIEQGGPGEVRFSWMLPEPPASREDALRIRDAVRRIPMLLGTVVSEDDRAAAIFVPVRAKQYSHQIAEAVREFTRRNGGPAEVHVTGLPVAEDTFGVEMFQQMAIAAPAAGLVIFLMMLLFFRSPALITAPMLLAMATVVITMGILIGLGFPVHIMSSMIPIFLMPIAVVDSVHILSEFADDYPATCDARVTIRNVVGGLFTPMLYTSLTSAAGFFSLAFTPIPPVQIFGLFVAGGILLAFVLTVTFVPAWVVRLSPERLEKMSHCNLEDVETRPLVRALTRIGDWVTPRSMRVILATVALIVFSVAGIAQIRINDNPVRWFRGDHEIRVADRALNHHFAGTYMAHFVVKKSGSEFRTVLDEQARALGGAAAALWRDLQADLGPDVEDPDAVMAALDERIFTAEGDEATAADALLEIAEAAQQQQVDMRSPELLAWMEGLQSALVGSGLVGKTSSVADIVKTVYRELLGGAPEGERIPETRGGVAQALLSYQSSHRPQDVWHMVSPDFREANMWLQLRSGDNRDMSAVVAFVDDYLQRQPLPDGFESYWAGMTYLNLVWQNEMVRGMLESLLSSFAVVFLMMVVLFRSVLFGLISMIPLSVTIVFIYGLVGWFGKDYDMPIAVLSSLTLGLSVDFAIHFLERFRETLAEHGSWPAAMRHMFEEPVRAISRNAIVIAVGFLPLLISPLVPYNTVGIFMALIMLASSVATILLLPAVLQRLRHWLPLKEDPSTSEPTESLEVTA